MSSSTPATTTPIRKKKRLLTASKIRTNNEVSKPTKTTDEPKKKKKRQLQQPILNLSASDEKPTITESTQPQQPVPSVSTTTKRSIRASSEAIAKREKIRIASKSRSPTPIEEEKPVIKKKRKLNSQKIIMPTNSLSQDIVFEETGNISYSEYLESSSSSHIPRQHKPNIVIGVPSKHNIIKREPLPPQQQQQKPAQVQQKPQPTVKVKDTLDLSNHSILPNSSYIAHLPESHHRKAVANNDTDTSSQSSEQIEHMVEDENHVELDSTVIAQVEQDTSTGVEQSIASAAQEEQDHADDMDVDEDDKEVLFTMDSDNYISDSSIGEFYDAQSDFEDRDMELLVKVNSSSKKVDSFWNSLFKSFSNK